MLLDRYEHLFFNANFKEAATTGDYVAYRGEFILKEGEVADAQGRRKPPTELLKQAVILAGGEAIKLLSGSLDELQQFPLLQEIVGGDITPESIVVLFVVNIPQPFVSEIAGAQAIFIPLVQGMVWNELCDLEGLDKADFKGQSSADKVVTLYNALGNFKPKYPAMTLSDALLTTNNAKRETHGAV